MKVRRGLLTVGAAVMGAAAVLGPTPSAGAARPRVEVLLDGLNSPKGLAMTADGNLIIAQGAFGPPAPVLALSLRGRDRGTVTEVTPPASLIDVAISPLDGTGWGIGPSPTGESSVLYHQLADGTIVEVLDLYAYQATDPDPVDQDMPPNPFESNPYGLTVMANGDALVADAAGNDLVRVTPDGVATTVARFDLELMSTDHLPPGFPVPAEMTAEAVPTAVTVGPDGAIYVGELSGFPFRPGTSQVWRIEADAEGAWCSVTTPDDDCTVYAEGFTAIQDIAFNPRNAKLWVLELAADGVLAFEAGFEPGGEFPPAVLKGVRSGRATEAFAGQLSEPGGLVVSGDGKIYVTDGVFTGGRVVRLAG